MMNLIDIQNRFHSLAEKEHWKKLQMLLFSKDAENIVTGCIFWRVLMTSLILTVCTLLNSMMIKPTKTSLSDDFILNPLVWLGDGIARVTFVRSSLFLFLEAGLLDALLWDVFCYRHERVLSLM